jgi:molybdopterin synthase catalytic subunit
MLRENFNHGFDRAAWDAAKAQARDVMIRRARVRGMIPYSDLVREVTAIRMEPHDPRLFYFLGEIASEEDEAGRGMLTVVVVHKTGDMQPGPGFFELANHLGRDTSDILRCWIDELKRVHKVWATKDRI